MPRIVILKVKIHIVIDILEICSYICPSHKKNSVMIILFEGIHGPYPMQYAKPFGYQNPLITARQIMTIYLSFDKPNLGLF